MTSNKPYDQSIVATLSSIPDAEATAHYIKDETGSLVERALASGPMDNQISRKIRTKIDRRVLPLLCITYAFQFMVKTSMDYCSVYGIFPDYKPHGQDYSWIISIFYFGYLAAEYPSLAIMQKFRLAKFLGVNMILWGAILMTTAACSSFACFATVRFSLGVVEATISPGFVAITGIWWTRQEQASRSSLWISFLGVGSFIGTLLVYGLAQEHAQLGGWKRTFLKLGGLNLIWGVLFSLAMPDSPVTVTWLNENEKIASIQRVMGNKTGTRSRRFVKSQVVEAVTDPKIIILGLISFVNAIASGGLVFGSSIIQGFGFDPLETALLNLPLSVIQVGTQIGSGFLFARIRNSRLHIASLAMILPIVGTMLINQLQPANKWGRLVGVWLLGSYPVGFMTILGLLSTNIAGTTKRSVASGWVFVCYCAGHIFGPQFFKSTEAPAYRNGIKAIFYCFVMNILLNQVLRIIYDLENKRRDRSLEGKSEDEVLATKRSSELQGFKDVTDKDNVMFRYAL
ncbi:major facilitator superfamily domain-containing protein [Annulohypoxylon truncatum]|uniref:major facilitator superfamily domain-containing protein n=1 Tax=Annulohypoxylon truncatum TaxID=327061 RepID=UPI002007CC17|nr:major facilitator superfamily domain-containing protein [Annulohypoxylon truncatum]KAI1211012.1 major facilitator superfamily domain-containing protein [Annulohypoxylon truncatum]